MDPKDIFEQRARRDLGPLEQKGPLPAGPLESVDSEIYERLPLPIKDTLPRAIEFRRKTKSWFSFPYHCLMAAEYHPHDRLTLSFSTHLVVIKGRSLEPLYERIQAQNCARVSETDRATKLQAADTDTDIEKIDVYDLSPEDHAAEPPEPAPGG